MSRFDIVTFGCRLNSFESELMRGHAEAAGLGDAVIFNTCAVTGEAVRQARQAIRRARRERPGARIIVTGCAAQLDADGFAAMAEVDQVLGNREKLEPASFTADIGEKVRVSDIMAVRRLAGHLVDGFDGRTRAFVEVQQGCDHRCTFCIIPFARGPNRSAPAGAVIEQIRRLCANGYREMVLTGVDIASYGADLPGRPTLTQLLRRIFAAVPELPRLRLSSLDVAMLDDDFLRLLAEEERLMPHLHLSLQAGDDLILKRMARRHSRADALAFAEAARRARPDVVFGADLIAGFPTEDDAAFDRGRRLIGDCDLVYLHVFPYSVRDGTPAARMPQVPVALRKERAAILRADGGRALERFLAGRVGHRARVLVEVEGQGRSEQFAPVVLSPEHAQGAIVDLTIHHVDGGRLAA